MKNTNRLIGLFFVLTIFAFASCEKNEATKNVASGSEQSHAVATIDYEKPYMEVLTVPKNHYSVSERGMVFTSRDLLYSKILTQVTLTKRTPRNVARFSMTESESEYIVTVNRVKAPVVQAKVADNICTNDPKELSKWVLEATLEGYTVEVCFDKESGMWNGHIVKE